MAKKKRRGPQQKVKPPADPAQPELSAEERAARRAQQKIEWAQQKRAQERAAGSSYAPLIWAGGVVTTLVVIGIAGFLLLSGGGSSATDTGTPRPTVDSRVSGQTPSETFAVAAQDDGVDVNPRFSPSTISAKTGEVFEIDVTNTGSSAHNLVVAGLDTQYGTADDFTSNPSSIPAGSGGKVLVRIDKPGTYQFHCDFHPTAQIGTLTIAQGPSVSASPTLAASASPSVTPTPTTAASTS